MKSFEPGRGLAVPYINPSQLNLELNNFEPNRGIILNDVKNVHIALNRSESHLSDIMPISIGMKPWPGLADAYVNHACQNTDERPGYGSVRSPDEFRSTAEAAQRLKMHPENTRRFLDIPLVTKIYAVLKPGGYFAAFQDGLTHGRAKPDTAPGFPLGAFPLHGYARRNDESGYSAEVDIVRYDIAA